MNPYQISVLSCVLLFAAMLACTVIGHRFGRRMRRLDPEYASTSTSVSDAAVLSLVGLLMAFTFSNAYGRYDNRRKLIVDEVNAIGTAYLRLDLLSESAQPAMRVKFREYVKSRHEVWRLLPDPQAALAQHAHSEELQREIWKLAVSATDGETHGDARKLLLPALNEMIDLTTTRLIAVQSHPPLVIFLLLGILSLGSAWIVGFGMSGRATLSYPHMLGFATAVILALYVILDIEYPRFGLVTLETPHQLLSELERHMQ